MIEFALAVGPGSAEATGHALTRAVSETSILAGAVATAASPDGSWAFAAVDLPDAFLTGRWHQDGRSLVAMNGPLTTAAGALRPAEVLATYRRSGSTAATARLTGTGNLLCVAPEHGVVAWSDLAALWSLYHGSANGVTVISTRPATVAAALGTTGWDVRSLAWLVSMGTVCGEHVPVAGVRSVPPGRVLVAPWGSHEVSLAPSADRVVAGPDGPEPRDDLDADEWDAITEHLLDEVRPLAELDTPIVLPLTGGKDSRLALSLLSGAGIAEVRTYTEGAPDDPDARCAAAVASAAGVSHQMGLPSSARLPFHQRPVPQPPSHERRGPGSAGGGTQVMWDRIAAAVGRYDGMISPVSGIVTPTGAASTIVHGWGGELYRYRGRFVDLPDLLALPSGRAAQDRLSAALATRIDPLGLLTAAERDRQRTWIRQWVGERAADTRIDLVGDEFYLCHRLARWNGVMTERRPLRVVALPLVSRDASRLHFGLTPATRADDRLHFEVMSRLTPELVALPFAGQRWSSRLRDGSRVHLPNDVLGAPLSAPRTHRAGPASRLRATTAGRYSRTAVRAARTRWRQRWSTGGRWSRDAPHSRPLWTLVLTETDAVVSLIDDAADAGLADVCDVGRLRRVVRRPGAFTMVEQNQVIAAIGAAMTVLDRGTRVQDAPGSG